MAAPAYRTRLEIVFAAEAAKAVILRRGPKAHFHLILWDLEADRFEHGQWLKGFVRLCDLSADGARLLYWAHQYHHAARERRVAEQAFSRSGYDPLRQGELRRSPKKGELRRRIPRYQGGGAPRRGPARVRRNQGVWTALSRPPYFTALALWPSIGHWTGGGFFITPDQIALCESDEGLTPQLLAPPPPAFRIRRIGEEGVPRPVCPSASEDWGQASPEESALARKARLPELVAGLRAGGARWVEFVSPRPGGDLLFGCDGRVLRLRDWRAIAPQDRLGAAEVKADLNGLSFQRLPPPAEALLW